MTVNIKRREILKVCHVCKEEKPHASCKSYTCNECLSAGLKWCMKCKTVHPINNFYKNGNTIRSICKQCEIKENLARYKRYKQDRYKRSK